MRTKYTATINNITKKIQKLNHKIQVNYDNLESEQWEEWTKDTVKDILKTEAEKYSLVKKLDRFEELHLKEKL